MERRDPNKTLRLCASAVKKKERRDPYIPLHLLRASAVKKVASRPQQHYPNTDHPKT